MQLPYAVKLWYLCMKCPVFSFIGSPSAWLLHYQTTWSTRKRILLWVWVRYWKCTKGNVWYIIMQNVIQKPLTLPHSTLHHITRLSCHYWTLNLTYPVLVLLEYTFIMALFFTDTYVKEVFCTYHKKRLRKYSATSLNGSPTSVDTNRLSNIRKHLLATK